MVLKVLSNSKHSVILCSYSGIGKGINLKPFICLCMRAELKHAHSLGIFPLAYL